MQCAGNAKALDVTKHNLIGDKCRFAIEYRMMLRRYITDQILTSGNM